MPKHSDKQPGKAPEVIWVICGHLFTSALAVQTHMHACTHAHTYTYAHTLHNHMPTYSLTLPEECSLFQVVDNLLLGIYPVLSLIRTEVNHFPSCPFKMYSGNNRLNFNKVFKEIMWRKFNKIKNIDKHRIKTNLHHTKQKWPERVTDQTSSGCNGSEQQTKYKIQSI